MKAAAIKDRLALMVVSLLLTAALVSAQSLCLDCFKAAQEELKKCLDNAISEEDKIACADNQEEQAAACENGECKVERERIEKKKEGG